MCEKIDCWWIALVMDVIVKAIHAKHTKNSHLLVLYERCTIFPSLPIVKEVDLLVVSSLYEIKNSSKKISQASVRTLLIALLRKIYFYYQKFVQNKVRQSFNGSFFFEVGSHYYSPELLNKKVNWLFCSLSRTYEWMF